MHDALSGERFACRMICALGERMNLRALIGGTLLALLQGCDVIGPMVGVTPGSTVSIITATQYEVTVEYTHDYDFELPAAGRIADQQCQRFGKNAALVSTTRKDIDRSYANFRCE
jgi:hypothetical protein